MKQVLIVDDEKKFLLSLVPGLENRLKNIRVLTAHNGEDALDVLNANPVDLLVTDLKMPKMDGFELLASMKKGYPHIPVIVMTAFGTPEIEEELQGYGAVQYLEKPTDLETMTEKIRTSLSAVAKGFVEGITLPTFAQLIELEKKTCTLQVASEASSGAVYFVEGQLFDACCDNARGDKAALEIFTWDEVEIKMLPGKSKLERQITMPLNQVLLEALRLLDEKTRRRKRGKNENAVPVATQPVGAEQQQQLNHKEKWIMTIQEKLKDFKSIDGFVGVGIFTPSGESLALLTVDPKDNSKEVGILSNTMLLNAQKMSREVGIGQANLVHIEADHAHVFARCLNEGSDPVKSEPGKAHIHMVLVLNEDSGVGLAKMKMEKTIRQFAEEFRM